MRLTTKAFARFHNVGKTYESKDVEGSLKEILTQLIEWTKDSTMGNRFEITIARNQNDLSRAKVKQVNEMDALFDLLTTDSTREDIEPCTHEFTTTSGQSVFCNDCGDKLN